MPIVTTNKFAKLPSNSAILMASFVSIWFSQIPLAQAQDTVIAKIGDVVITDRELGFAETDMGEQFSKIPEEVRKAAILNAMIDIKVLAADAEKAGMADDKNFKARVNFFRERTLHNAYFQKNAIAKISDEAVKARYEKEIKATKPEKEIEARHILVKTEEEAKAVIAELDAGKDFAELAKAKSTGPSGANGGTLGFFKKGQMVPEFETAAFALENGAHTKTPVKTQFGWHVILKQDERDVAPPKFEDAQNQIRQILLREKYISLIKDSRKNYSIEIVDETLKAGIEKLSTDK